MKNVKKKMFQLQEVLGALDLKQEKLFYKMIAMLFLQAEIKKHLFMKTPTFLNVI